MFVNLEVRSYDRENPNHQHDHTQLVLPIRGRMEINVDGREGFIDQSLAAVVMPGSAHSQLTHVDSRFLILDCAATTLEALHIAPLAKRVYLPVSPATRRLIEFAELIGNEQLALSAPQLGPLLLSSLLSDNVGSPSAMAQLIGRLRATPGNHWSNEVMAHAAGMSISQLHQRFRLMFGQSPQAFLTDLRIQEAQRWLRGTSLSIAEIALRAGFCDQASLTRAMQRVSATTPAAYRKVHKQPG